VSELYAEYQKEVRQVEIYEPPGRFGFISYIITGATCHVADAYLLPEYRGKNYSHEFWEEFKKIVKERGVNFLTAMVFIKSNVHPTHSLHACLHHGFRVMGAEGNCIYLDMEI
jgi:GNAT superfamily N-acetyltransferase